eukprot:scaffold2501_cov174-Amphora_coffeaeformis.AAC.22
MNKSRVFVWQQVIWRLPLACDDVRDLSVWCGRTERKRTRTGGVQVVDTPAEGFRTSRRQKDTSLLRSEREPGSASAVWGGRKKAWKILRKALYISIQNTKTGAF